MQPAFFKVTTNGNANASAFTWLPPPTGTLRLPQAQEAPASLIGLEDVWRGLVDGTYAIVSTLCSESRCFAALQGPHSDRTPARAGDVQILARILLGESQKSVAADLGCALSTVSHSARQCLQSMGWPHLTSRVPVLLVMAAHAARGFALPPARLTRIADPLLGRWLVSVERPDCALATRLSPSEWSIARFQVEGRSYGEMAKLRRTSVRTIANQVASIFNKLGVSGRSELLAKLVQDTSRTGFERAASGASPRSIKMTIGAESGPVNIRT